MRCAQLWAAVHSCVQVRTAVCSCVQLCAAVRSCVQLCTAVSAVVCSCAQLCTVGVMLSAVPSLISRETSGRTKKFDEEGAATPAARKVITLLPMRSDIYGTTIRELE